MPPIRPMPTLMQYIQQHDAARLPTGTTSVIPSTQLRMPGGELRSGFSCSGFRDQLVRDNSIGFMCLVSGVARGAAAALPTSWLPDDDDFPEGNLLYFLSLTDSNFPVLKYPDFFRAMGPAFTSMWILMGYAVSHRDLTGAYEGIGHVSVRMLFEGYEPTISGTFPGLPYGSFHWLARDYLNAVVNKNPTWFQKEYGLWPMDTEDFVTYLKNLAEWRRQKEENHRGLVETTSGQT